MCGMESKVVLTPIGNFDIPVEAEAISPDVFAGKSLNEIRELTVLQGPQKHKLSEFFEVSGEAGETSVETTIVIEGDVDRVKLIGYKMSGGKIVINGNAGMHVGDEMSGGEILVRGDAGSWTGMDMKGGTIVIEGNAKDHIGCTYRGKWRGMSGGMIHIKGDAGNNVGGGITGGSIVIDGNVGAFCGIKQNGGLTVVRGDAKRAVGAEMSAGTIVVEGHIEWFTPGFEFVDEVDGLEINGMSFEGAFLKFRGDYAEKSNPKGELYVSKEKNPEL